MTTMNSEITHLETYDCDVRPQKGAPDLIEAHDDALFAVQYEGERDVIVKRAWELVLMYRTQEWESHNILWHMPLGVTYLHPDDQRYAI